MIVATIRKSALKLVSGAVSVLSDEGFRPDDEIEALRDQLERSEAELEEVTCQAERDHRRAAEYLEVVYSLERQRDEWREKFHKSGRARATAIGMVEKACLRSQNVAKRAILMLNEMRNEQGLDPVKGVDDLKEYSEIPGVAVEYAKQIKYWHDQMPASLVPKDEILKADERAADTIPG